MPRSKYFFAYFSLSHFSRRNRKECSPRNQNSRQVFDSFFERERAMKKRKEHEETRGKSSKSTTLEQRSFWFALIARRKRHFECKIPRNMCSMNSPVGDEVNIVCNLRSQASRHRPKASHFVAHHSRVSWHYNSSGRRLCSFCHLPFAIFQHKILNNLSTNSTEINSFDWTQCQDQQQEWRIANWIWWKSMMRMNERWSRRQRRRRELNLRVWRQSTLSPFVIIYFM